MASKDESLPKNNPNKKTTRRVDWLGNVSHEPSEERRPRRSFEEDRKNRSSFGSIASDFTGFDMGSHTAAPRSSTTRRVDWAGNVEEKERRGERGGKCKRDIEANNCNSTIGDTVAETIETEPTKEEETPSEVTDPSTELTISDGGRQTPKNELSSTNHVRREARARPLRQWVSFRRSDRKRNKPNMSYEMFVWIIFTYITILAIVDRFTTNVWPRQVFSIGGGSAGNDRLEGFKPGPWSVVAYDIIARVSGRFSICCFNLLLITRLRFLEEGILSCRWICRLLDCSNITKANLRLHKWNAIALCVLTFIHVWSILLPCVTHGYTAKVIPGTFEYPLSERTPAGFKDADPVKKQMGLQVDDIWRMVEMTILLCFLTPLSVRWLSTRWHIGMPLHRLINVLYFVDIVRRHSHPHSWVLNTPVFCAWIADKVWFWYSNRNASPEVYRSELGNNYMAMYWKQHENHVRGGHSIVSPDYFLRLRDSSFLESSHVFTCFENRTHTTIDRSDEGLPPFEWTVGCIVRVFRDKRKPALGKKDKISHTARMYDVEPDRLDVTAWGPYHSEMSGHLKHALLEKDGPPTTVIGTGSGIGYIIDVLQWRRMNAPKSKLKVLFSTRDVKLYHWAKMTIEPFAKNEPEDGSFTTHLALTGAHVDVEATRLSGKHCRFDFDWEDDESEEVESVEGDSCNNSNSPFEVPNVFIKFCHHDFETEIVEKATVFSQGSQSLNEKIAEICKAKSCKFYGGLQAPERIELFDALIDSVHQSLAATSRSFYDLKSSLNFDLNFGYSDYRNKIEEEEEEEAKLKAEGTFGPTFQRRFIGTLLAISAVSLSVFIIREFTMGDESNGETTVELFPPRHH